MEATAFGNHEDEEEIVTMWILDQVFSHENLAEASYFEAIKRISLQFLRLDCPDRDVLDTHRSRIALKITLLSEGSETSSGSAAGTRKYLKISN